MTAVRATRREWAGLAVLALPTLLITFDLFVLLLALPYLSADLKVNSTEQLWILDIYGFMVGGFLITMGNLGDRIGRRKLLMFGATAFGVASVISAYSTSPEMLIAARALLGIAGATLAPSTLSLISNMFRDPKQMGVAIGIWAGCFSLGAILGPIVGGVMLEHFWWGSVFLLGVPVMVLLLVLGPVLLPEYRAPEPGRLDLTSVAMSLAAILPFIYGVKELAREGWAPVPIAGLVVGLVFGVLFVRRQRALADPLLDLSLFGNRDFSTMLLSLLAYGMIAATTLLFITQYFESVSGLSPLQAALGLLPGMAIAVVSTMVSPILARWIRPAYLISGGLVGVVASMVWFTQIDPDSGPTSLVIGFAVIGLCDGPLLTLGTNLVVGSAPPEKAGSASSMAQISNEFGAALGVATVGTIGTFVYRTQIADSIPEGIPAEAAKTAGESIAGAGAVAGELPAQTASTLLTAAREAFTTGLNVVAVVGVALVSIAIVLIMTLLRHLPPMNEADQGAEEDGQATDEESLEPQTVEDLPQR
ncbi:MFS transporter [Streptosporangium carneum]|nr:MFS transporter [Streptosporangium carneum]